MADELTRAFDLQIPRPIATGAWRPGDVRHIFAAADQAEEHLGFRAEVSFASGMREFATAALRS